MKKRTAGIAILMVLATAVPLAASPGRKPGPATVAVVHSDHILLPKSFLAPSSVYPLGKLDYSTIARMLDCAVMLATNTPRADDAWRSLASPSDRVGILLDAQTPPASLSLVDALIDRLVAVGVRPGNVIVWATSERALFTAGLVVRKSPEGVNTMGADSEGFLGGLSRIVLSYCDVLINLARLRPDPRIGMWGAVANQLACVPEEERISLLSSQRYLPSAAARPSARMKFKLHILDALRPNYEPGALTMPPFWVAGKLLASTDCVALDVIGQQILQEKRAEVRGEPWPLEPEPEYLGPACGVHRLGQADLAKITVVPLEVAGK